MDFLSKLKQSRFVKLYLYLRFVKLWAYKSAKSLQTIREESHEHRYTYYYGFQIIYGAIVKGLLLIAVSYLLGILIPTLVLTGCFALLRVWSGGLHFDSYTKCAYISLASLLVFGCLARYVVLNDIITYGVFIFALIIFILYAPVEHVNRPLKEEEKKKYKVIAITTLILMFILTNIFNMGHLATNSIAYGVLMASLIATPIVNKIS